MQTELAEFEARNMVVLGISASTEAELREKLLPQGITFPLLADPDLEAIDAYGLRHEAGNPMTGGSIARPAVVLIDESGKIVEAMLTENWRVRPTPELLFERWAARGTGAE